MLELGFMRDRYQICYANEKLIAKLLSSLHQLLLLCRTKKEELKSLVKGRLETPFLKRHLLPLKREGSLLSPRDEKEEPIKGSVIWN